MQDTHTTQLPHGWTLLEFIIVLSIMTTLILIILPNYQLLISHCYRHRAEMRLAALALELQTYHQPRSIQLSRYNNSHYHFKLVNINQHYFSIAAIPIKSQLADTCGIISIDSLGRKIAATTNCW